MVDSVRVLHHRGHEELALEPLEHLRPLHILPRSGRIGGRRRPPVGGPYGGRIRRRCGGGGRGVAVDGSRGGVSTGHITTARGINTITATAAGQAHSRYLDGQAIRCRRRHCRHRDGTTTRDAADLPGKRGREVGSSRTRSGHGRQASTGWPVDWNGAGPESRQRQTRGSRQAPRGHSRFSLRRHQLLFR